MHNSATALTFLFDGGYRESLVLRPTVGFSCQVRLRLVFVCNRF